MPRLGPGMSEGRVLRWRRSVGDPVAPGDVIADIETDKANVELEAQVAGVVADILVGPGAVAQVGALIARIDDGQPGQPGRAGAGAATPAGRPGKVVRASPRARSLAAERGVDLGTVAGTGPGGLVTGEDVLRAGPPAAPEAAPGSPGTTPPSLSPMRRAVAARTARSHATIPPFSVTRDVRVDRGLDLRATMAERGIDLSVNDLVLHAVVRALAGHPRLNAWFVDGAPQAQRDVNVALAVELEEGLVTPVLPRCQGLSLEQLAVEAHALVERARSGRLRSTDLQDATITVSNLGMLGVTQFTAIVDPPQVAVVAVGAVRTLPAFEDGRVTAASHVAVTVCADHRAVDGADVARFLEAVANHL